MNGLHWARRWAVVGAAAVLCATLGASTPARASCMGPEFCPCVTHEGTVALRATVVAQAAGYLRLQVDEVLGTGALVEVGEEVGGSYDGALPCGGAAPVLAVGDVLLVLYDKGDADGYPGCLEYRQCTEERCSALAGGSGDWDQCDGECVTSTSQACATHREEALLHGRLAVTLWGEVMDLGGADGAGGLRSTRPEELSTWLDAEGRVRREVCEQVYAAPLRPECDDVVPIVDRTTGGSPGCGLAAGDPQAAIRALSSLALLAALRLRRRGSQRVGSQGAGRGDTTPRHRSRP